MSTQVSAGSTLLLSGCAGEKAAEDVVKLL